MIAPSMEFIEQVSSMRSRLQVTGASPARRIICVLHFATPTSFPTKSLLLPVNADCGLRIAGSMFAVLVQTEKMAVAARPLSKFRQGIIGRTRTSPSVLVVAYWQPRKGSVAISKPRFPCNQFSPSKARLTLLQSHTISIIPFVSHTHHRSLRSNHHVENNNHGSIVVCPGEQYNDLTSPTKPSITPK